MHTINLMINYFFHLFFSNHFYVYDTKVDGKLQLLFLQDQV